MDLIKWNRGPLRYKRYTKKRIYRVCCLECEKGVKNFQSIGLGNWAKGLKTLTNVKNIGGRAVTGDGTKAGMNVFNSGHTEFAVPVGYPGGTI